MTTALLAPEINSLKFLPLKDLAAFRGFESGEREIDRNLEKCCEWQDKHRARVFCAHMDGVTEAYGFYCLGISAAEAGGMDADVTRANDGRKFVPFIYVYYIAVRQEFQNKKIGTMLLGNMLSRCGHVVRNVGVFGIALNALTPRVCLLYERYGFRQRNEMQYPLMILPTQSLIELTKGEYSN
jgi:GNAT superfamily N-acetyltransferase